MRCPVCGYPNPEEAPTCFQCGGTIESPNDGMKRLIPPHVEAKKGKKSLWSRSVISESWWIWLIGIALIVISFLLPWGSLLVYNQTPPDEGTMIYSTMVSLSELLTSGDTMVMILVWIFIAGLLLCILFPKMVIIPIGALILLPFFVPEYILTKLPPEFESNQYYADPNLAGGYFFGWLALFILGTLALSDFRLRFTRGRGKDQSPMEDIDPNSYSWLWRR
jgi:hypothetical protein